MKTIPFSSGRRKNRTWFYKDHNKLVQTTYEKRIEILDKILTEWSNRTLTWLGKITVLKSLCISKCIYSISSIETPQWFLEDIKK